MKKSLLKTVLAIIGIVLIVFSLVFVLFTPYINKKREEKAIGIKNQILSILPKTQNGTADDRSNVTMPSMELMNDNFIGIIEIPLYEVSLPIASYWNSEKISKYPHRYMGSVYNNSLIIGGSGNSGQFDFMKNITETDAVFITDMTGMKYSYSVYKIELIKEISNEYMQSENADLILFARTPLSSQYTVVFCKLGNK